LIPSFNLRELLAQVESGVLHEACKKKDRSKSAKKMTKAEQRKRLKESTSLTIEALETIIEMVKTNSLTLREQDELIESIETVFNNVADDYEETSSYYTCSECGWEGSEPNTDDEGENICPDCDSYVDEVYDDEDEDEDYDDEDEDEEYDDEEYDEEYDDEYDDEDEDEDEEYDDEDEDEDEEDDMYESAMLNKTPPAVKKAAKAYARSASGKKAKKISAKKRAKYASKINACSEKGKTFSFKSMTCIKSKKQR
jgi:Zn finger protein HypA/HybF involved in hydrogenase expression